MESTPWPKGILWHIKGVSLKLGVLCDMVEGTAHALASLDCSFAAIFTGNNPSLTFSFHITIDPRLFKRITKIAPNPLRLLEEKRRLILEFDEDNDHESELENNEELVTGDTDSEHGSEGDEESDTSTQ
ncbi:uncharacterized protein PHACADRAFT_196310 [Phanerochaete carnosa HHB-10118-sp]|uniref:Uncharacterized protein n=1 Tax=Phanerochaete carnosa (strain HHB-10118-sp) TaxID=650164 RepID=K5VQZ2_PHACS|nr:uncharacterized protein PHACADRAFT_196310 [Phanerochaete carnosa HHB-10118-sp]EKM53868.1 hypothetical protein PHACADRAFT_196310 [Phanerochaete carnosa HHB-10118-sp]